MHHEVETRTIVMIRIEQILALTLKFGIRDLIHRLFRLSFLLIYQYQQQYLQSRRFLRSASNERAQQQELYRHIRGIFPATIQGGES